MRTRILAVVLGIGVVLPVFSAQTGARHDHPTTSLALSAAHIPAPKEVLGFEPGDDCKLASWNDVIKYFEALSKTSDRVKFEELGKSTMDKPFVMATISASENLARLDAYRKIQESLADPRKLGPPVVRDRKARELIARGKTIVLITCGIHSTEVGSYLSSMLIAYRLASSNDPEIQSILHNTIILLVPSLNPDGVDIVKNWYDKTLGTPYEGTNPPELYHKYVGHDNNRDWYAFTQVETQIAVDKIHNVWHPQIVHDIHQQGALGSRLFVPPYMPPVEPNVPKQIVEGYTELGNFMAREMRSQGFKGITTDSTYDAWSPSRAYSHYHGGVRILSETASCKIATPITVKFSELRPGEGYDPRKEAANFGPVWRGGDWHLRDITNYMTTAAFLLLRHASENRQEWLQRFYEIGKDAVRPRKKGELFAYEIVPSEDFRDNSERLLRILQRGGVEFHKTNNFIVRGKEYDYETAVVRLNQPYAGFAKALLEPQSYPDLRNASGSPISPYDVTAHSLPLLMGVEIKKEHRPFTFDYADISYGEMPLGGDRLGSVAIYKSQLPSIDEGWTRWVLEQEFPKQAYSRLADKDARSGNIPAGVASIVIPDQPPKDILNGYPIGTMPPEYTGGLGQGGVKALRNFVEQGGTLVCLNRASDFAIEQFKLPLRDLVAEVPETDFFVPGSILRIELDTSSPLARGMPKESIAWVEDSPVFEVIEQKNIGQKNADKMSALPALASANPAANVRVIARYPSEGTPLLSGWLLGANRIKGKAALVEVTIGKGRIILFGFRPQYRGQSLATYPLFFNAISGK